MWKPSNGAAWAPAKMEIHITISSEPVEDKPAEESDEEVTDDGDKV